MTVPFNAVPNTLVPFFWAEINSGGTPAQVAARLLLIGQKTTAGLAAAGQPIRFQGDRDGQFGVGSMMAQMIDAAQKNAGPLQEIWCLPLADNGAGVAASGKFRISAVATVVGDLTVYIAGQPVRIAVAPADTAVQVAARLVAAINAGDIYGRAVPVIATQGVNPNDMDVIVTARNKGTLGNMIRLEVDYYGNEGPLAAVMVTITAMASGATDPLLTSPIATLSDMEFDYIGHPYADATSIGVIATFLDNATGRWSPYQQLYGCQFTAKDDTSSNLVTLAAGLNDANTTIMGYKSSPSPPWAWAACYAGVATRLQFVSEVPRPLMTLPLVGILPPKLLADRFGVTTRQTLYMTGIAGWKVDASGQVIIDRCVTTYKTSPSGVADRTWLDIEDRYKVVFGVRYLRNKIIGQWGRSALAETNPLGNAGVATVGDLTATLDHGYLELVNASVFEDFAAYQAGRVVERNAQAPDRVDIFLPVDLVNALRIVAANVTAFQQFPHAPVAA